MPEQTEHPEHVSPEHRLEADIRDMTTEMTDMDFVEQARVEFEQAYRIGGRVDVDGITEHHFVMPNIPGGAEPTTVEEMMTTVRETKGERVMEAGGRLITVRQGEMFYLSRTGRARIIKTATSSCSTVVAVQADRLAVAHVSMSERGEIEPLLDKLRADGFDPAHIWVTAAVGPTQEAEAAQQVAMFDEPEHARRMERFAIDDYEATGIPRDHILDYEYTKGSSTVDDIKVDEFQGGQTYITLLSDGTVRLVAVSIHMQQTWIGGSLQSQLVDGTTRVLGSTVVS